MLYLCMHLYKGKVYLKQEIEMEEENNYMCDNCGEGFISSN